MNRPLSALALCASMLSASISTAVDLGDGLVHLRHVVYPAQGVAGRSLAPDDLSVVRDTETWIVAFQGPADDTIRSTIRGHGGRIVGYVPSNAYLVRGSVATAQALMASDGITRVDLYRTEWRIAPELDRARLEASGDAWLAVEVWDGESVARVADAARALGVYVARADERPGLSRLLVRAGPEHVDALAAMSEVEWIEEMPVATLRNDVARWVIQSNDPVFESTPLYDNGLFGQGQIIGHIDGPLQLTSCFFVDSDSAAAHPGHRKVVAYHGSPGGDNHGTHTAGTAAGENEDLGFPQHRGHAPKARLSHTNYLGLLDGEYNGMPSNLLSLLDDAHTDGARVHTNSWGDDALTSYTSWCVDIDTFLRNNEEDLVLFAVTNLGSLRSPENAKNSLAVGASYSHPNQGLHWSGGSGPTSDGRRKPEVYAPGRDTRSASTASCGNTTNSGTSMACPAVSAGATLIREYFQRGFYPLGKGWAKNSMTPTGALLKAMVVNSTVDMVGPIGYPNNQEGWGRILLDDALYFPGDARRLWIKDLRNAEGLSTGAVREYYVRVDSPAEPLKVTMAFTDMPASLGAAIASVNDLDLEVEGPGGLFRGNVFNTAAGVSMGGGNADVLNNLERVIIASPAAGFWTIRVRATSVPSGPQGFALVVNADLDHRFFETAEVPPNFAASFRSRSPVTEWKVSTLSPNPFLDRTEITFSVPEAAALTVRVYDISGRRVRTLIDRRVGAGEHRATWNGDDDSGLSVSPGIYFVRLTAPGVERTVRAVRLR